MPPEVQDLIRRAVYKAVVRLPIKADDVEIVNCAMKFVAEYAVQLEKALGFDRKDAPRLRVQ